MCERTTHLYKYHQTLTKCESLSSKDKRDSNNYNNFKEQTNFEKTNIFKKVERCILF